MSGIKEIEYAMKGEQQPKPPAVQDFVPDRGTPYPDNTPKTVKRNVFKLANPNKEGGVRIQGIDHVIDPRTVTVDKPLGDGPEMIRLLSGVTTIWAKEQKNISEEYIRRNLRFLEWPRGTKFMSIPDWDVAGLEFARLCRHNRRSPNNVSGSKTEFFEYDPNEAARAQYEAQMLEIQMVLKANEQTEDKMKKHAFYLGIPLFDSITGAPKSMNVLRTEYILRAKNDPKGFKMSFDSKEVDVQFLIRNAIVDGKIDITRGDGKAYWGRNGAVICVLPKTEMPIPYLTQLALTNSKEGKDFLKELERQST